MSGAFSQASCADFQVKSDSCVLSDYPPWNQQFAPENRPSQKETSIPTIHFQGQTVSFRECNNCEQTKQIQTTTVAQVTTTKREPEPELIRHDNAKRAL